MSLARASGFRNIGAAAMGYIPVVYASKLLEKFHAATVFDAISNTDYQGEIKKFGQSVIMRTLPDMNIRDYQVGGTLTVDQPISNQITMDIDRAKSWSFIMDDVDEAQTDIKDAADKWATENVDQLKVAVDTDCLSDTYSGVASTNTGNSAGAISGNISLGVDGGTSVAITPGNVISVIESCMQVLDETNTPDKGERFFVIPPWMWTIIMLSDLKSASLTGDNQSIMRNGQVGEIGGFKFYKSNLLPTSNDGAGATATHCLFGHKVGITFASQILESKMCENTYGFGMIYKGLQVYGKQVVIPGAVGDLYVKKG